LSDPVWVLKNQHFHEFNKNHFVGEDPRKGPFEDKKRAKEWHQGKPLMKKPELSIINPYFTLGFCHEARTPEKNARLV